MSLVSEPTGRVFGNRYRLLSPLGTGASAHVFLAEDLVLQRRVAIKVLQPALAGDEAFLRRFASCGVTPERLQVCYAMAENVFAVTQTQLSGAARVIEVDRAAFERDHRAVPGNGMRLYTRSKGVPYVIVNGRIVFENGAHSGAMPGRVGCS